ncbi:hypothetical protein [Streptomyces sp. t39]|uniref:hypothetical protein n=1 Tax=Streptomyces sp. t39 TaxID=1828156 RepID=UPI0011CDA084|nr:hypothetical protein [Streptomyces sp. t39]TXS39689.1 hypothetical protein EAO77_36085 [Streptomyces sp. t39]
MISRRKFSRAACQLLAAESEMPVGRGKAPVDVEHPPYYLAYAMGLELPNETLADEHADASIVIQFTAVSGPDPEIPDSGGNLDQVEWMADKAREVFLARDPATGLWLHEINVPGVRVYGRSLETEAGGTNDPADAIIGYVQRFRFDLTPA